MRFFVTLSMLLASVPTSGQTLYKIIDLTTGVCRATDWLEIQEDGGGASSSKKCQAYTLPSSCIDYDGDGSCEVESDGTTVSTAISGIVRNINTYSSNQLLGSRDHIVLVDADSVTLTLPACASNIGREYQIKNIVGGASTVTIDGNASETIDGATTQSLTSYQSITIRCDGVNGWWVF